MNPQVMTEEQELRTRLQALPPEIMELITDGPLDATTASLKETYELTDDQVRLLENEIILTLAFFAPRSEFVVNVKEALQIDQSIAEILALDIESEIFELVEEYFEIVEETRDETEGSEEDISTEVRKKEELRSLAQTFGQPSTERLEKPNVETLTGNVEPLRTMEGDMNRIHGYGAFRETQPTQVVEAEVTSENTVIHDNTELAEKELS